MHDDDAPLLDWIAGLTPEAKAAQLLMVAPDPTDGADAVAEWLGEHQYGGLFLQWRHLTDRDWMYELVERLHDTEDAAPPPFLGTDEEGGLVSDLAALATTGPAPLGLAQVDDLDLTYGVAQATGAKLRALGFNLVFAPCLDVHSEPRNPVIGTRAFGTTPEGVVRHGLATVEGIARSGVIACIKHFPGHGATRLDSHAALPVVDAPLDTLRHRELVPFRAAIDAGIPMIMTAHVEYPALDPAGGPATLSPEILTEILREELGFSGVIISDDMEMEGVAGLGDPGSLAIQALEAGVDLLLYARNREMAARVRRRLALAMLNGELSEDRVDQSLLRLGRLRLAARDAGEALDELTREEIVEEEHEEILKRAAADVLSLVGGQGPDLPIPWQTKRGLWVIPSAPEPRLKVDLDHLRELIEPLGIKLLFTALRPRDFERDKAVARAREAGYVVACTLSRGGLYAEQRRLIDALAGAGTPLILAALLDPGDLTEFPSIQTRIATFGFGPLSLDALVKLLVGRQAGKD